MICYFFGFNLIFFYISSWLPQKKNYTLPLTPAPQLENPDYTLVDSAMFIPKKKQTNPINFNVWAPKHSSPLLKICW